MRGRNACLSITITSLVAIAALSGTGCSNLDECGLKGAEGQSLCATSAGGSGSTGGGGASGSGGTGGEGGTTPGCDPTTNAHAVASSCGVFVSSSKGKDSNAGSEAAPVKTIEHALTMAKGKPIYLCNETFDESVVLPSGLTVFGALDCHHGWAWTKDKRSTIHGTANSEALTLEGDADVSDVDVEAADATKAGGSSIAVFAKGGEVNLTRSDLTAAVGKKGADGKDASVSAPPTGPAGNPGKDACSAGEPIAGGAQKPNTCGSDASIGGKGGDGNNLNGGHGDDGQIGTAGGGGTGEPIGGGWNCDASSGNGGAHAGDNGPAGDNGAAGTGTPTLTSTGYAGIDGGEGGAGKPGQGGGGGGGAKGGSICPGLGAGASGGSGGAGGCGGAGGGGGKAGGASIALVSVGATVMLTDCTLKVGSGGDGGIGGDFQPGASGGQPGPGGTGQGGSNDGCDGGKGGKGGNGGPGGGGEGGASLGIAFSGKAPTRAGKTTVHGGTPGDGGLGGNADDMMNHGDAGPSGDAMSFGG